MEAVIYCRMTMGKYWKIFCLDEKVQAYDYQALARLETHRDLLPRQCHLVGLESSLEADKNRLKP